MASMTCQVETGLGRLVECWWWSGSPGFWHHQTQFIHSKMYFLHLGRLRQFTVKTFTRNTKATLFTKPSGWEEHEACQWVMMKKGDPRPPPLQSEKKLLCLPRHSELQAGRQGTVGTGPGKSAMGTHTGPALLALKKGKEAAKLQPPSSLTLCQDQLPPLPSAPAEGRQTGRSTGYLALGHTSLSAGALGARRHTCPPPPPHPHHRLRQLSGPNRGRGAC